MIDTRRIATGSLRLAGVAALATVATAFLDRRLPETCRLWSLGLLQLGQIVAVITYVWAMDRHQRHTSGGGR